MAVEAGLHHLFPPQLILNRELGNSVVMSGGAYAYNAQQMRFLEIPSAAALPGNQFFHRPAVCECVQAKTCVNADSGVTYNISGAKKRGRDSLDFMAAAPQKMNGLYQLPPLAGGDVFPQIQQYQCEINPYISPQTKKMRLELEEERQRRQARLLEAAMGEGVMKKLKEKDEQIQRISKLNFVLQERVKTLFVENQLWRDLAQTNEANANSLRSDLEQVLHHVGGCEERVSAVIPVAAAAEDDDAESCCSSNSVGDDDGNNSFHCERRCRICNDGESSVLFLPCRHLCLCSACGSGSRQLLQACPVCDAAVTATLHVNMA